MDTYDLIMGKWESLGQPGQFKTERTAFVFVGIYDFRCIAAPLLF